MPGKLYLIPSTIGDSPVDQVIPPYVKEMINHIRFYIVENERTARRMLIKLGINTPIDELTFLLLNKHTSEDDVPGYLQQAGDHDIGLLSEAGVPAIADPGSEVVRLAHEQKIEVIPLVGPSSILLTMMASGFNGQNFAFVGYLPVKGHERTRRIKQLEQRSGTEKQSQLFIEAPYRNNQLLIDLLNTCSPSTRLCIGADVTSPTGYIKTQTIKAWKQTQIDLHRIPTLFILHKD